MHIVAYTYIYIYICNAQVHVHSHCYMHDLCCGQVGTSTSTIYRWPLKTGTGVALRTRVAVNMCPDDFKGPLWCREGNVFLPLTSIDFFENWCEE